MASRELTQLSASEAWYQLHESQPGGLTDQVREAGSWPRSQSIAGPHTHLPDSQRSARCSPLPTTSSFSPGPPGNQELRWDSSKGAGPFYLTPPSFSSSRPEGR